MMGHREKLKSGDEWDAFSRRSRKMLSWPSGALRKIKRAFWKRQRSRERAALAEQENKS